MFATPLTKSQAKHLAEALQHLRQAIFDLKAAHNAMRKAPQAKYNADSVFQLAHDTEHQAQQVATRLAVDWP